MCVVGVASAFPTPLNLYVLPLRVRVHILPPSGHHAIIEAVTQLFAIVFVAAIRTLIAVHRFCYHTVEVSSRRRVDALAIGYLYLPKSIKRGKRVK
jgi:hypothetical protein